MMDRREWHHAMLERMSREDPVGYLNIVQQWGRTSQPPNTADDDVLEGDYRVVSTVRQIESWGTEELLKEAIRKGEA